MVLLENQNIKFFEKGCTPIWSEEFFVIKDKNTE